MTKKQSLLISFAVCIVAAILVWVAGSSQSIPDTINKSVVDASFEGDDGENNAPETTLNTSDAKGNVVQPLSAKTLQTLVDEKTEQQPLVNKTDPIDAKVANLDQTILALDKQLADKGITDPKLKTEAPTTQSASQTQRLQAIKDHLNTTQ